MISASVSAIGVVGAAVVASCAAVRRAAAGRRAPTYLVTYDYPLGRTLDAAVLETLARHSALSVLAKTRRQVRRGLVTYGHRVQLRDPAQLDALLADLARNPDLRRLQVRRRGRLLSRRAKRS